MNKKRTQAGLLALFLILSSLLPYREAQAIIPQAAISGLSYAARFVAPRILQNQTVQSGILASASGGLLAYELISNPTSLGEILGTIDIINSNNQKVLEIQADPNSPPPTPEGWTSPTLSKSNPTPPSSTTSTSNTYNFGYGKNTDLTTAAQLRCGYNYGFSHTVMDPRNFTQNGNLHSFDCYFKQPASNTSSLGRQSVTQEPICPTGYSGSSTCTLTNESLVQYPSDGTCRVLRSGNNFSGDPRDPDCSSSPNANVTINGNEISITNGKGQQTKIVANSDGTLDIRDRKPQSDGTTREDRIVTNSPLPGSTTASTTLSGGLTNTYQGTGSTTSNVALPFYPSSYPSNNSNVNVNVPSLDIPSDYNREVTQIQSYEELKKINDSITNENIPLPNVVLPVSTKDEIYTKVYPDGIKGVWDNKKESFKQTQFVQALNNFVPNFGTSTTCPSFLIDFEAPFLGHINGDLSPPCWLLDALGALFLLSTAFLCRRIIFGG